VSDELKMMMASKGKYEHIRIIIPYLDRDLLGINYNYVDCTIVTRYALSVHVIYNTGAALTKCAQQYYII